MRDTAPFRQVITLLLVLLAMTGCVTTENLSAGLDTLIGEPEAEVVRIFGPPDSTVKTGQGESQELHYKWHRAYSSSIIMYGADFAPSGSAPYSQFCNWSVAIKDGRVVRTSWDGHLELCNRYFPKR